MLRDRGEVRTGSLGHGPAHARRAEAAVHNHELDFARADLNIGEVEEADDPRPPTAVDLDVGVIEAEVVVDEREVHGPLSDRRELHQLWAWLCGDLEEPQVFDMLRDNYEGRYATVADYVAQRLAAELPARWRWITAAIDHAAVGERWIAEGKLVVLDASVVLHGDELLPADEPASVFIFIGKG